MRKAWLNWGCSTIFVLLQVALQTSVGIMIDPLQQDLQLNLTQIGFLGSIFFYSYIFLQIPSGILVDKYGVRITLLWSILFTAFACVGYALSHHLWQLLFCRLLMGVGCAPAICIAMTVGAQQFPARMFAMIAGLIESLAMLGGVVGEEIFSYLVHHTLGWRKSFMLIAGCLGGVWILSYFLVDKNNKRKPNNQIGLDNVATAFSYKHIFTKEIILNGFYCALVFTMVILFASLWGIPFLKLAYGLNQDQSVDACALIFLGLALAMPIIGFLDKKQVSRAKMMLISSFLSTLLFSMILISPIWFSRGVVYVSLFLLGIFASSYLLPFVITKENVPEEVKGSAIGFINMMCFVVGALFLQPLSGVILERFSTLSLIHYQLALSPVVFCYLAACLIAMYLMKIERR